MTARKLALLGHGSIGTRLLELLEPELTAGALEVSSVVVRDPEKHALVRDVAVSDSELAAVVAEADLVVECAGVPATVANAPVLAEARALVLTSVGALADPAPRAELLRSRHLMVTSGAIGGFDVLAATAEAGALDAVALRTHKLAAALVQPWMSDAERERLETLAPEDAPITIFEGNPAEAIKLFPANVNIAVALAWATRGCSPAAPVAAQSAAFEASLERVRVKLVADPAATQSRHEIVASGWGGHYEVSLASTPSPQNPRSSGLTAMSVAHNVRTWLAGAQRDAR